MRDMWVSFVRFLRFLIILFNEMPRDFPPFHPKNLTPDLDIYPYTSNHHVIKFQTMTGLIEEYRFAITRSWYKIPAKKKTRTHFMSYSESAQVSQLRAGSSVESLRRWGAWCKVDNEQRVDSLPLSSFCVGDVSGRPRSRSDGFTDRRESKGSNVAAAMMVWWLYLGDTYWGTRVCTPQCRLLHWARIQTAMKGTHRERNEIEVTQNSNFETNFKTNFRSLHSCAKRVASRWDHQ